MGSFLKQNNQLLELEIIFDNERHLNSIMKGLTVPPKQCLMENSEQYNSNYSK